MKKIFGPQEKVEMTPLIWRLGSLEVDAARKFVVVPDNTEV